MADVFHGAEDFEDFGEEFGFAGAAGFGEGALLLGREFEGFAEDVVVEAEVGRGFAERARRAPEPAVGPLEQRMVRGVQGATDPVGPAQRDGVRAVADRCGRVTQYRRLADALQSGRHGQARDVHERGKQAHVFEQAARRRSARHPAARDDERRARGLIHQAHLGVEAAVFAERATFLLAEKMGKEKAAAIVEKALAEVQEKGGSFVAALGQLAKPLSDEKALLGYS